MLERIERKDWIIIGALIVIAAVSFFMIASVASSEDSFTGTYSSLEEKRTNVTELMGAAAASSTAISLLPGDAGTPIADQLADLSGYFMFILAAIYLEKWMVTITGMLAFKILIPASCGVLIIAQIIRNNTWKTVGIKLVCFALMMFAIVPASVVVTEKIDASYQASMQQTIEDTENDTKQLKNTVGNEKDDSAIERLLSKVKGGVEGQVDKFENTLNRITESIAVLIVTSCAIPIAVVVFFLWLVKLLTGINIEVPKIRMSKKLK
ncbi:MAG: beta-carotene 15,15'-monooxygenase [Bacillota bacterium]|nr:beta-carotene 15,15'-monooxygenase [Bacillota bacterium]